MADERNLPGMPADAPKVTANPDDDQMAVPSMTPGSTWNTFSMASSTRGKDIVAISNAGNAVPLDDLVEMRRRDSQVRMLLRMMYLPILSCLKDAKWYPPEEKTIGSGNGEKEAEFANMMFTLPPQAGGMSTTMSKVTKQTLLSLIEGFSAFEEVRVVPEKGPLKGKITLRKLVHLDSRTIRFLVDKHGGFAGIKQISQRPNGESVDVELDPKKCWYHANGEDENPFYGVSMFEPAWYHYDIKTKLYFIANIAAQSAAVPGRVGEYPKSASVTQKQAFRNALQNFGGTMAMTHPTGFKVSPMNGNSGFDFIKLIDHHSHAQAKSVLQAFADTENRMVLIDNGKADASADLFVQGLKAIMDEIAESWTHYLMPKYIDWNFNNGVYPVYRFGKLGEEEKSALQTAFTTVITSSVLNCTPEFVREVEKKLAEQLDLEIDYEKIEATEAKAAQAQAEQAKAQAEADAAAQAQQQDGVPVGAPPAGPGAPPAGPPKPPKPPSGPVPPGDQAALAAEASSLDDIVKAAQELFENRAQPTLGYEEI